MNIPVQAVLSSLPVGETSIYRLTSVNVKKVTEPEFMKLMSVKTGMTEALCRFFGDCQRDVIYTCLGNNEAVDMGFLYAKLYPTGTIASLTEQPTKEANPIKARVFFKGDFAKKIAQFELVNQTVTVNATLYEFYQDGASDVNRIESSSARVVVNGNEIKIDANQADNGVWLEHPTTGVKVAQGVVSQSDSSTCHCTFPTLPTTGLYRFVLATRNGEDPAAYALARATRNVFVVNGEVSNG